MSAIPRFHPIIRPGVWLMQRLPMSVKLLVLAAVVLLPLSLTGTLTLYTLWGERATVQRQLSGWQVQQQLVAVAAPLLEHQGQMRSLLAGHAEAAQPLQAARDQLRPAVAALDVGITAQSEPDLNELWQPLRDELRLLLNTRPTQPQRCRLDGAARRPAGAAAAPGPAQRRAVSPVARPRPHPVLPR